MTLTGTVDKVRLSVIRAVKELIGDDWRSAAADISNKVDDFEAGGYRFIRCDAIDQILEDELSNDAYVLGCFNASFIAECTGWPITLIEAAQKGEAYEALGQTLIDEGKATKMVKRYAEVDGYGHHFAHYDSEEHGVGSYYYAFRCN